MQWLQTHCGQALIFWGKSLCKDMLFLCPQWSSRPYISRNFLIWTHFVKASWKKPDLRLHISSTTHGNQCRERYSGMRYSSKKLSNDKVITTACNFSRQIACSFPVMNGNQTRPGDLGKKVHACSLRFSALNSEMAYIVSLTSRSSWLWITNMPI